MIWSDANPKSRRIDAPWPRRCGLREGGPFEEKQSRCRERPHPHSGRHHPAWPIASARRLGVSYAEGSSKGAEDVSATAGLGVGRMSARQLRIRSEADLDACPGLFELSTTEGRDASCRRNGNAGVTRGERPFCTPDTYVPFFKPNIGPRTRNAPISNLRGTVIGRGHRCLTPTSPCARWAARPSR